MSQISGTGNTGYGPTGTSSGAFFDPSTNYGATQNWTNTPYVKNSLDPTVQNGVYMSYLNQNGLGGSDRLSDYLQNYHFKAKMQSGYEAALRTNPALQYRDYLTQQFGQHGQGFQNLWSSMSPTDRGEQPNIWGGPARTIGWG